MSSADLVETLIKCQNTALVSLSFKHTHFDSDSTHFLNLFDAFCFVFHAPLPHVYFFFFLPLFSLTKYIKIHRHAWKGKKKVPFFCYSFTCHRSRTPTHTGFPLISRFFYLEGQRHSQREGEERVKWSYRFELHTVSILPSLNDLNKEFNTAGSE